MVLFTFRKADQYKNNWITIEIYKCHGGATPPYSPGVQSKMMAGPSKALKMINPTIQSYKQ